jgi:heme/copper-type cytochrome/quinol oxidase subunit 2
MAYQVFFTIWALLLALVVYHLLRSNHARRPQFRGTTYSRPVSLSWALAAFVVVLALALLIRR